MWTDIRTRSTRIVAAGILILAAGLASPAADEPPPATTPEPPVQTPAATTVPPAAREIDRSPANMWRHGKAYSGFGEVGAFGCNACQEPRCCCRHCCCCRALSEPGGGPCTWCLDHCLYRILYPISPWYTNPRDGRLYPAYGTAAPACTYIR
jgi:hypothetical protein